MAKACQKQGIGRREILAGGGVFAAAGGFLRAHRFSSAGSEASSKQELGVYEKLGLQTLINCKGTFTIISGSLTLPEVKRAMDEASRHYVHLDELMDAVGRRLTELTGAQSGIVTAGCSAAETLATCACIAGGDPENINRLPNLEGLKDEVIIPRYSRNVYDHAVRMLGVRIVTVENLTEFEAAMGPRTAMVYVLACPEDTGPFGLERIAEVSRRFEVPVFVDAAAENLDPGYHLSRGADLVAYSGGKAIRGPQCAGLLLGRKDLCQAAWMNSAPHHAFGRSSKVGKEEIIGMLAAVEMWYRRDHEAEWRNWETWLDTIARRVEEVSGVSTRVVQPESRSNHSPRLRIEWDGSRIGVGGDDIFGLMLNGEPRVILARSEGNRAEGFEESAVEVMPWMMEPGDAEIVAERMVQLLANPPRMRQPEEVLGAPARIAGHWDVKIDFMLGSSSHKLLLEQSGGKVTGTHLGRTVSGDLRGRVEGDRVVLRSLQRYEGARLHFTFSGTVQRETMGGTVDLGEYGEARWKAHRHQYRS